MEEKTCTKCKKTKPVSEFSTWAKGKDGYSPWCKRCHCDYQQTRRDAGLTQESGRWNMIRWKYGLSKDDWEDMYRKQAGRCAICLVHIPDASPVAGGKRRQIHVDHDHKTKKVRGLLCNGCNTGLGKFKEDPSLLEKAAAYLRAAS